MTSKYRKPPRGLATMSDRAIAFEAFCIDCTLIPLIDRTVSQIDENAGRAESSNGPPTIFPEDNFRINGGGARAKSGGEIIPIPHAQSF
jgi:hypothetical protein